MSAAVDMSQHRGSQYRKRRRFHRAKLRQRSLSRVQRPIDGATRARDPLARPEVSRRERATRMATIVALSLGVYFGGAILSWFVGTALTSVETPHELGDERIAVQMIESPPPPEVELEPEPAPELVAPVPPPKAPEPREPIQAEEPPADPIDLPPADTPPPPADAKPRRRVVGLNFESTVSGGGGPAFAVGNTRMGQTAREAEDPTAVEKLPARSNRSATRIPTAGGKVTKPRRIGSDEKPEYPSLLREQGIEADVVLTITVSPTGEVTAVRVIKGSPYPEFNDAATALAERQRYEPARRGDRAVAYTLKFTVRFRLDD